MSIEVKTFEFKILGDQHGSLVSLEGNKNIPFDIKRVYYIFDTKEKVVRGKHAHKKLKQVLICISGSCKLLFDNGKEKIVINTNKHNTGYFIDSLIWHEMYDFSPDCILMVLADDYYNESDYIRNYTSFKEFVSKTTE